MATATNELHKPDPSGWKRRTALYLGSQSLSMFGSSLVQYSIFWHVTLSTQSGSVMTLYVLAGFLPQILVSLFGGVWADRYPRKKLIMITDTTIAFCTLILACIFLTGYYSLWLLFFVSSLRAIGGGIMAPAVNAVLPQIVPQEHLMRVNGINGSLQSFIYFLSPALGGVILTVSTLTMTFFVDVVTAIAAVLILAFIPIPVHQKARSKEKSSYLHDLREGLQYAWRSKYILELCFFYLVFCVFIVPAAFLSPLMIARVFGDAVWMLTVNEVVYSGGAIIGGLIIAAWGGFANRAVTIAFSSILFGFFAVGLGYAPVFWLFLMLILFSGIVTPFAHSSINVMLQERVEENILGRIMSLLAIIGSGAVPLGMVIFGPLADRMPMSWLFTISGATISLLGLSVLLNKNLRKAGVPLLSQEERTEP